MSFLNDIARIADSVDARLDEMGRAIKIELFSGVIQDTRVKTGRAKGNWQTSESAPILTETDRLDPTGRQAVADVVNVVEGISLSYLTNNLPYIEYLEELDAMVARNQARVRQNIERKARELNK